MQIVTIGIAIVLSVFSTCVMSYVAMVAPIAPWIAPTLVVLGTLFMKPFQRYLANGQTTLAYAVCAGSVGGIVGTAFGFYFPTIYFLDSLLFSSWMAHPLFFVALLAALTLAAGVCAFWCVEVLEDRLIRQELLPFSVAELTHQTLHVQHDGAQSVQLLVGMGATTLFCFLQQGFLLVRSIIPAALTLVGSLSFGVITTPLVTVRLWPLLWAIGFVAGPSIIMPLLVGMISQWLILDPINQLFFKTLPTSDFLLAFCSGMVVIGALESFVQLGVHSLRSCKKLMRRGITHQIIDWASLLATRRIGEFLVMTIVVVLLFTYLRFPLAAQWYVIAATLISVWQISAIAGKTGLATMGRYATLVMVPGFLFFALSSVQAALVATFVGASGGIAADLLFGRKLAVLEQLNYKRVKKFQVLGLVISACVVGIIFWLLINHFGLGSPQLFAQRAQARQLILQVTQFDYYVLLLGAIFGFVVSKCSLNGLLVFTGLLMSFADSFGLILGGLAALVVLKPEKYYPFWSGVFAANSLWMVVKALF